MIQHPLGSTALNVSVVGFGSAPVGYLNTDRHRAGDILNLMLDGGANLIDTAASYPGSEELIGSAIGHRRHEFFIVSKCGGKLPDLDESAWSAGLISKTVERSLAKLKTDRIDVMLLHSCDLATLQNGGVIEPLLKAQQAGKIKFIGYSGDNEAAAHAAGMKEISVVEMSVNIVDQLNLEKVLPICRKNNVGVLAKRPIANAAWKDISEQQGLYRMYVKTYVERLEKIKLQPADLGFADADWPEIALRFSMSIEGVHCAIIGTTNPENARANLALTEKGPLPAEAVQKIRAAYKAADPQGTWTGQT